MLAFLRAYLRRHTCAVLFETCILGVVVADAPHPHNRTTRRSRCCCAVSSYRYCTCKTFKIHSHKLKLCERGPAVSDSSPAGLNRPITPGPDIDMVCPVCIGAALTQSIPAVVAAVGGATATKLAFDRNTKKSHSAVQHPSRQRAHLSIIQPKK